MKALVFTDIKTVTMHTVPEPNPAPNEALLKVHGTGICGSDLAGFVGHSPRRKPPLILGHEALGVIEKMPDAPAPEGGWGFELGQRVVVNPLFPCGKCVNCLTGNHNICNDWRLLGMDKVEGAFADYAAVPAANLFAIPDSLPDNRAVMIEPLANGVHLFTARISRHHFGNLAIMGAGTQGCLLLSVARMLGYREIAIVDVNPKRLAVAEKLGAKYLLNAREKDTVTAIRDVFPGGADIVIDAVGDEVVRRACIGAVRKGGEVIMFGLHEVFSSIDFTAVARNEINIKGSFCYNRADFAHSKTLIENGDVDFSQWTEVRPLEEGQPAFDKLITDPGDTMKIMLTP